MHLKPGGYIDSIEDKWKQLNKSDFNQKEHDTRDRNDPVSRLVLGKDINQMKQIPTLDIFPPKN